MVTIGNQSVTSISVTYIVWSGPDLRERPKKCLYPRRQCLNGPPIPWTGIMAAGGSQSAIMASIMTPPPAPRLAVIMEVMVEASSSSVAVSADRACGKRPLRLITEAQPDSCRTRCHEVPGADTGLRWPAPHPLHNITRPARGGCGQDCGKSCRRRCRRR